MRKGFILNNSIIATSTALLLMAVPTHAELINYSFETVVTGQGTVAGGTLAVNPAELVGVTGGAGLTWNQGGYQNVSSSLLDSDGNATGVSFTTDFTALRSFGGVPVGGLQVFDNLALIDRAAGRNATATITFTGLTSGLAYDIWLMGGRGVSGNGSEGLSSTISTTNAVSSSSSQILDNNDGGSQVSFGEYVENANFVFFDDVVADSSGEITFSITGADSDDSNFDSLTADSRPGLSGFQIEAIPEPSSLALLGLGGLCVLRRRRG
ncbi:MAG: PEP-CTERM sorting domain-containing protein [Planctomycetota bacterium]